MVGRVHQQLDEQTERAQQRQTHQLEELRRLLCITVALEGAVLSEVSQSLRDKRACLHSQEGLRPPVLETDSREVGASSCWRAI